MELHKTNLRPKSAIFQIFAAYSEVAVMRTSVLACHRDKHTQTQTAMYNSACHIP